MCLSSPSSHRPGPITSTMGKLLWAIQAWFVEMENDERSEAIRAGQARARAAGKQIGRPRAVFRRDLVAEFRRQGLSLREIARRTGVGVGTVRRVCRPNSDATAACQNCAADNLAATASRPDESSTPSVTSHD